MFQHLPSVARLRADNFYCLKLIIRIYEKKIETNVPFYLGT
jgi:hypothetical protein